MKNIITIITLLLLPICVYTIMEKHTNGVQANAKENIPSIITFTSTMCLDCQKMKEVLKEVEPIYKDKVNFISYNALKQDKDIQKQIKEYEVVLVPTIIILDKDKKNRNKIEGYISKEKLIGEIEDVING